MSAGKRLQVTGRRLTVAAALATAIAIPAEGLRQFAYYDPPGILTVCYGSTHNVQAGRRYSLAECRARLDQDMQEAIDAVENCVPGLPDAVLAAFGDAVYNLGPAIACDAGKSAAARYLKAGELAAACQQLPRWNKARVAGQAVELPGLTRRRKAEMDLCLTGQTPPGQRQIPPSPPFAKGGEAPALPLPTFEKGGEAPALPLPPFEKGGPGGISVPGENP